MKKLIVSILVVGLFLSTIPISTIGEEVSREQTVASETANMVSEDGFSSIEDETLGGDDIDRWAVIIGVSDYKYGSDSDLKFPHLDAEALYDLLQEEDSRWNTNNIQLLINETATKQDILDALDWLRDNADEGDIILFFFSGHGDYVEDKNGDEPDGMDEGICPYDSKFITDDELSEKFDNISEKDVEGMYLMFDSCLSGGLIEWRKTAGKELLTIDEIIEIINGRIQEANSFTTGLTTDISIDNKVVLASTTPHGVGIRGSLMMSWVTLGAGICEAIKKGKTTAEDISPYAKWWYLSQPEFLKTLLTFLLPLIPLWILLYIQQGVTVMPLPMWKDGYPADAPWSAKLPIMGDDGSSQSNPQSNSQSQPSIQQSSNPLFFQVLQRLMNIR